MKSNIYSTHNSLSYGIKEINKFCLLSYRFSTHLYTLATALCLVAVAAVIDEITTHKFDKLTSVSTKLVKQFIFITFTVALCAQFARQQQQFILEWESGYTIVQHLQALKCLFCMLLIYQLPLTRPLTNGCIFNFEFAFSNWHLRFVLELNYAPITRVLLKLYASYLALRPAYELKKNELLP